MRNYRLQEILSTQSVESSLNKPAKRSFTLFFLLLSPSHALSRFLSFSLSFPFPFSTSLYPSLSSLFSIPLFPRGIFFAQRPYETAFFCSSAQLFAALVRFHPLPHWFGPPLFRVGSVPPSFALVRAPLFRISSDPSLPHWFGPPLFRISSDPLSSALVRTPTLFRFPPKFGDFSFRCLAILLSYVRLSFALFLCRMFTWFLLLVIRRVVSPLGDWSLHSVSSQPFLTIPWLSLFLPSSFYLFRIRCRN